MRLRAQSPQTHLVLRTLFEAPEQWHYGYDLSRTTGLQPGTLYPILARLTERGLLTSQWEAEAPEGRPRRHLYRLSEAGVVHVARLPPPAYWSSGAAGGHNRRLAKAERFASRPVVPPRGTAAPSQSG